VQTYPREAVVTGVDVDLGHGSEAAPPAARVLLLLDERQDRLGVEFIMGQLMLSVTRLGEDGRVHDPLLILKSADVDRLPVGEAGQRRVRVGSAA